MSAPEGPGTAPEGAETPPRRALPPRLHAAQILCDTCGRPTLHRIVRWNQRVSGGAGAGSGLARCRECGWTHAFEVRPPAEVEVDLIVSRGASSERSRQRFPASTRIAVGAALPGSEPALEVRKIESAQGRSVGAALVSETRTVWAVPESEPRLPVSIVEGSRTRSVRWPFDRDAFVGVGDRLVVDAQPLEVVAVRARGRTWRVLGDRFAVLEIQRIYGRRTVSPPAGRSDWRRVRGTPNSWTSSTSRAPRSRSSPGARSARTAPWRRNASGGATVHRVSPA